MSLREVDDMDVVSDSGSVPRRIVAAEYAKFRKNASCYLGYVGKQIVRYTVRVVADES